MKNSTLFYVHDPMCSWCWGFEPVRAELFAAIEDEMTIRCLVGGLATDSDQPMPAAMQASLQQTWQHIEQVIPGTRFNYAFWSDCSPRRSTYPSNRAVLAAREQGEAFHRLMSNRIQQAYYLEARNPSDNSTLIELAADIGLDTTLFADRLVSVEIEQQLQQEIQTARSIGADSFPSLLLERSGSLHQILVNYTDVGAMLNQIRSS